MGNNELEKEVEWYDVYHELAKLLAYESKVLEDKEKTRGKVLFELCMKDDIFTKKNHWVNILVDKDREHHEALQYVDSFDPMQIFASFNGFGMSDDSRIEKINIYFRLLGSEKRYKKINFTGCPSPMMLLLVSMRRKGELETLWKPFIDVMNPKKKKEDIEIDFKEISNCFGVTIKSFTILLFWIDSKNFLPLDKNTIALFETNNIEIKFSNKSSKENKQIITISEWKNYIKFLNRNTTSNEIYRVIARMAWDCTSELSEPEFKDDLKKFGITKCPRKSLKIIAIKPLGECNPKFLKGLKENQIYLFDKAYTIDDEKKTIEYNKQKDIQLFNQKNLNINITAIVGENGTGKSTLVELLLAVINNIIYQNKNPILEEKVKKIKWKSTGNFSLAKKQNRIQLKIYKLFRDYISIKKIEGLRVELIFEDLHIYKVKIDKDKVQLFEYKDEEKDWKEIKKLHQKQFFYNILVNYSIHSLDSTQNSWIEPHFYNDCDTDIVIEPFRENGNINIQKEEKIVKERLIINLLEPETNDEDGYSFRQITDTLKADSFVALGTRKEYELYRKKDLIFDINDISEHINRKIENNIKNEKQSKTIKSVMPKNFFTDIILSNGVRFSQLSSGEKQKIYSINSIVYHIQRLDKKKYKHINLILDEIELYFHPELQRTYIHDIIEAIKKVGPENILGINITFITHSPFILSDIPESKILFLEKEDLKLKKLTWSKNSRALTLKDWQYQYNEFNKKFNVKTIPKKTDIKTFGANIHNLLSNGFFMKKGLMGEFAKNKIQEIMDFLNSDKNIKNFDISQEQIKLIIENIGEDLLRIKLLDMYYDKFEENELEKERQQLIEKQNEIAELIKYIEEKQKNDTN